MPATATPVRRKRRRRRDFIESTLNGLLRAMQHALDAEATAKQPGFLQCLDPRVKLLGLTAWIVAAAQSRQIVVILAIFAGAVLLAMASHISMRTLALREWLGVGLFTGLVAAPAIFIIPGRVLYRLPILGWPITQQGLSSATYLLMRVETCATLALLLILCTPWTHVLKALRILRVPVVIVVILGMTHRYIFLMLQSAGEIWEARHSRRVGALDGAQRRRIAAGTVGVLLNKSFQLSNEVYLAMQARGFRGEVYTLDDFSLCFRDWVALACFAGTAALALWFGSH